MGGTRKGTARGEAGASGGEGSGGRGRTRKGMTKGGRARAEGQQEQGRKKVARCSGMCKHTGQPMSGTVPIKFGTYNIRNWRNGGL